MVLGGLLAAIILVSSITFAGRWLSQTFFRAGDLIASEEDVRLQCQQYRTDVERAYTDAQNIYTQEVVLTVQDLANVSELSNEQKQRINESALDLIFQNQVDEQGNETQGIQGFVGDLARTGIQFDQTDDELNRQIARAVRDGRFKFTRQLEEFTLKKQIFENYIYETRVQIGDNQILDMANYKGCYNSAGGTEEFNNADAYFAQFVLPTTQATEDAFNENGFDAPVLDGNK